MELYPAIRWLHELTGFLLEAQELIKIDSGVTEHDIYFGTGPLQKILEGTWVACACFLGDS